MKRTIFTLALISLMVLAHAQSPSDFGSKDVLLSDFETKTAVLVDSLWTDSLKTTPITIESGNVTLVDNPLPLENTSVTAAKYIRPAGAYKSIFMRFDNNINLSKTPYLQVQIYPVLGKSPVKTSVNITLLNDKGEVISASGSQSNLSQDEWTTVSVMLGKQKSSPKYNTIEIQINPDDSLSKLGGTEYLIDQIGFKAPADGIALPATVFYEPFAIAYNADWQNGNLPKQPKPLGSDGKPMGEFGKSDLFSSIKGFVSGIPFTFVNADTLALMHARLYSIPALYEGASGGGRIELNPTYPGTLISGPMDVSGYKNLNLSFGIGTQEWWAYNGDIANARPKVEISVNGGAFYELTSTSTFLQKTGNQVDMGWGLMDEYQDQILTLVNYPVVSETGTPVTASTINLKMSYKAGTKFWIDDLWFAGNYTATGVTSVKDEAFSVYPNPATSSIVAKGAMKVTIFDLDGRMVKEVANSEKVDVNSLTPGVYLVKVLREGSMNVVRFIKK